MACFLVPAAEAVVVTAAKKTAGSKPAEKTHKISFVRKLKWLTNMLWGGSVLLCFEHIWHGEIVPWFPFLTAAENPADTAEMLHEMSTIGVTMCFLQVQIPEICRQKWRILHLRFGESCRLPSRIA